MQPIVIRTAVNADELVVRDCAQRAHARYIAAIGRKPAPMVADFAAQIAAGSVHMATGGNGRLAGFVVFYRQTGHVLLENVAVLPECAGRGVGTSLIRFCEDEARRWRCETVRLYTNEKMTDNLAIHPRLGYVETGRRIEDGFSRVHFEKHLR